MSSARGLAQPQDNGNGGLLNAPASSPRGASSPGASSVTANGSASSSVLQGRSGSYALLEVIGKGAYGTVHKGIWREAGRHVAIKRVVRAKLSTEEETALQAEIDLFKHLKHEHIVNYVEAVDAPDSMYLDIVMEYVEGGSLYSIVQKIRNSHSIDDAPVAGPSGATVPHVFPEHTVASFIAQVAKGLCYLHKQGVVHRDIKGANILVTKDSMVKLADFGVSTKRAIDASPGEGSAMQSPLDVAGTPYWMAPEIISLSGCSTVSDIWSVGCTVIELLTGFPPYYQLSDVTALFRIVTDECPPFPNEISLDCQNFLRACFTKDVNARATAEDLLRHPWLRTAVNSEGDSADSIGKDKKRDEADKNGLDDDDAWAVDGVGGLDVADDDNRRLNQYEEAENEDFGDEDFDFEEEGEGDVEEDAELSASASFDTKRAVVVQDVDPFREISFDPEAERETERLRKHREMWQRVKSLAERLGTSVDAHVTACDSMVSIFSEHPDQRYSLIYDPGLLPILEVLESGVCQNGVSNPAVVESMLRVVLSLLEDPRNSPKDVDVGSSSAKSATVGGGTLVDSDEKTYLGYPRVSNICHDLCLAGFLPAVIQYCNRAHPISLRVLAGRFITEMLRQESTLHMFAACRGFTVFVDMLEPDSDACGELPLVALDGVERMLSMEKQRHKRDFCRRFAWCGLLDRIVECIDFSTKRLEQLATSRGSEGAILHHETHIVKLARLLQTFAARADPSVKTKMSVPTVIAPIIRHVVSRFIPDDAVQPILCCVRDLSRDPLTHSALQSAAAIEVLVQYLSGCSRYTNTDDNTKTRHYIISCLHNLCIVSPARQEIAASSGLVPHLQTYIRSNDINLRSLCIDIYSGLACAGHVTRVELSKHAGVDFYVELFKMLSVPGTVRKWQARVLQSLAEWVDDEAEAAAVEERLVRSNNSNQICHSLAQMRVTDVEAVLEPYRRIIAGSRKVNAALGASQALISAMVSWLEQMYNSTAAVGGPRGRLLLLQILQAHARVWSRATIEHGPMRGLVAALRILLTESVLVVEEAITVREQASRLLAVVDG